MEPLKQADFENLKSNDLRQYLTERGVPLADASKQHMVLLAKFAARMNLPVNKTSAECQQAIQDEKRRKLLVDGGSIALPDPDSLKDGWEDGPQSYPDLSQIHVENYFRTSK